MGSLLPLSQFELLADGLDHPECVTWGPDGFVYAGGEAGQIYRVGLDGDVHQVGSTGGFILGLCLDGDGNVYACDSANAAIMRVTPDGEASTYFAGLDGRRLVSPNYPVFDRSGHLYFSESGEYHRDNGRLWVVRPDGTGQVLRDDVNSFPNGIAFDRGDQSLYVVLSALPGIARVPLGGGRVEVVAELPKRVPDGIALDSEGAIYVACYAPDEILRITVDGRLEVVAADWERVVLAAPTNVAFCGPHLDVLVVASLGRWHLTKTTVAVPGRPYHYPRLGGFAAAPG
jgi:sugar lactone lactonase YvrE